MAKIRITDITHAGVGWGTDDSTLGVTVAPFSLPGDLIEASSPTNNTPHPTLAYTIVEPSQFRQSAPCSAFPKCSGCSFMHALPTWQIDFKEQMVKKMLGETAKNARWDQPLQGITEQYRRKARLRARWDPKSNTEFIGFKNRFGRFIADVVQCEVLAPPFNSLIQPLRDVIGKLDARASIPQLELAVGDNDAALILRHLSPLTAEDRETLRAFAIKFNIRLFLQSGGPDSVELLAATSTDTLFFTLPSFNLVLQFSPLDFIQAHGKLNDLLVSSAIDWLNPKSHEVILDLFCGLGNFSLPIAQRAAQVIGIEGSSAMTERASSNAALNGITNTTFFACDLEQPIAQHSWSHQKYDAILLDPPRSGANNIIPALCEISPSRMVYVSCNPVTFARDAILLNSFGYNLSRVRVADMFPHTEHVETVGLFERT